MAVNNNVLFMTEYLTLSTHPPLIYHGFSKKSNGTYNTQGIQDGQGCEPDGSLDRTKGQAVCGIKLCMCGGLVCAVIRSVRGLGCIQFSQ